MSEWYITSIIREKTGYTLKYHNTNGEEFINSLDDNADFAYAQLTKYDFSTAKGHNENGFKELRKLGLIKLDDKGIPVEPVELSTCGMKLAEILVDFQYEPPGAILEIGPIQVI